MKQGIKSNFYAEDSKLPSKKNIDELRVRVSQSCKIELNDVLHAHNKDSRFLDRKFTLSYDISLFLFRSFMLLR